MESAWSNGKPAYRCRHGHTTASSRGPGRLTNAYIREDRILPHDWPGRGASEDEELAG
jgi:hypothetical protein